MFCDLWRGDYHISMSLKEIFWKRKVLTCYVPDTLLDVFLAALKWGMLWTVASVFPMPLFQKSSLQVQTMFVFLLFPGGLLLTLLVRELCLSLDCSPKPCLWPLPPLPYCLQLLPNITVYSSVYPLWFPDI